MALPLKDIAGTAGATVGLVIACSIYLQTLTSRFADTMNRYQTLCAEHRGTTPSAKRRRCVEAQIALNRGRCTDIQRATQILGVGELCFLATIVFTSLSVTLPKVAILALTGSITMLGGLLLVGAAVILDLRQQRVITTDLQLEGTDLEFAPLEPWAQEAPVERS